MSNALQPIFDLCWESGRIFFTWLFDGWIQPKINLDDFFIAANIKNSLGEYPRVVKNNRTVFIVKVPLGLDLESFKIHQESLEMYLNSRIKIENSSGWIRIEMLKELPKVIEYEIPSKTKELCIPFAKSIDGIEYIDFIKEPHILLTGSTGSGKSITLRNIITSLVYLYPNQIELALIDFKIVELSIFKSSDDKNHTYPLPVIIDGKIQDDVLIQINKSRDWLEDSLKKEGYLLEDIFYGFYRNKKLFLIKNENIK